MEIYPVRLMCKVLGISPQGYYDWKNAAKANEPSIRKFSRKPFCKCTKNSRADMAVPGLLWNCANAACLPARTVSPASCSGWDSLPFDIGNAVG